MSSGAPPSSVSLPIGLPSAEVSHDPLPATFTMRTYAVWSQNKLILAVLGTLGLACVVLEAVSNNRTVHVWLTSS